MSQKITTSRVNGEARRPLPGTRTPTAKTLIAFSALIMLLFCLFVAYQASKAYAKAIEEGKINTARLTRILADQVELSFLSIDLALHRAAEQQTLLGTPPDTTPGPEKSMEHWVAETPQIAALMMINARGVIEIAISKAGYEGWYRYGESVESDPAFRTLAEGGGPTYLGAHQTQSSLHPELIVMSRRITNPDGSFGGVMIAAVDPAFFNNFFAAVDLGRNRFIALMLDDGTPLFSGPTSDARRDSILDFIHDHARTHAGSTRVIADTRSFGGAMKIYSYIHLRSLPILTSVVVDEKDFLSGWRSARVKDISFLAIFTIFGSVLSYFALGMAKQISRAEQSEASAILASQAKSEFLANMSHELRTPLNAVIGFSEMLGAGYFGAMNEKQKERVQDINLCGTHLLQLISDILEFSKGEAGKLELLDEDIDMERAVGEAMRIVTERARVKHISLSTEIAAQMPLLIADKRKVRQMLLNLLSNAIKFTPSHGHVTVAVRLDHHRQMHLIVRDTGIGIAPEDIPKALAVFGQVHRSQSHEGTGLGLPLCKMFAELHGGRLQLTSEVGVGTTVRVIFPENRVKHNA